MLCSDCTICVDCIEASGANGYIVLACIKCVLGLYDDYFIVGCLYNFGTW